MKHTALMAALLLATASAQAAVTYSFVVDSAPTRDVGAWVAELLVTVDSPDAGGTFRYTDIPWLTTVYEPSGMTVNSREAYGWGEGVLGIPQVGQPTCDVGHVYACSIDASLTSSGSGWFDACGPFTCLYMAGTEQQWVGSINSDDNRIHGAAFSGSWQPVPLPATLALLGLGFVGLTVSRRQ